jgi:hypothetical protein
MQVGGPASPDRGLMGLPNAHTLSSDLRRHYLIRSSILTREFLSLLHLLPLLIVEVAVENDRHKCGCENCFGGGVVLVGIQTLVTSTADCIGN